MYVVTGDRQLSMAFVNPYMLGELGSQYFSRWANQTCVDTKYQFCNEAVNTLRVSLKCKEYITRPELIGCTWVPLGLEAVSWR
jgi:hypothetical protein